MKSKKSILILLAIFLMLGSISMRTEAATITPDLQFTGTTASCYVRLQQPGKVIVATMALWHGTTLVDSWSGTASNSLTLDKTHSSCVSGWTYTLKINGMIGGVAFSEITVSATC